MNLFKRLLGGKETPEPIVDRASLQAAVSDVWDLLIDDSRSTGPKPSKRELEAAYTDSDLVYSVCQEIIQAITVVNIEAGVGTKTLLEHPNKLQGWSPFISQFFAAFLTTGLAAVLKLPIGSMATQELHVLKTSALNIQEGTFEDPITHMSYDDGTNHYESLSLDDLITYTNPSAKSALSFASPLEPCWQIVKMDIQRSVFQQRALERLPYMVGVVETKQDTTKKQRDTLQASLKQILGGATLVLPNGAEMTAPGIGRDSITLPGLGEQAESRICAAYNVPAILVGVLAGLNRSTYSNYEEARTSFHEETIKPILAQLSDSFSKGLGETVTFTVEEKEEPVADEPEETIEDEPTEEGAD